jgi:hypothetical protein
MIYTIDTCMWIRSRLFHYRKGDGLVSYRRPTLDDMKKAYGSRTETIAPTCLEGWSKKYLTDKQT